METISSNIQIIRDLEQRVATLEARISEYENQRAKWEQQLDLLRLDVDALVAQWS